MSTATVSAPQLRRATLDEYEHIVRIESSNALGSLLRDEWRNLWLGNPLWPRLGRDWPIGWVLENAAGRLVGSLVNFPSLYKFRGQDLICANGRGWVVDPGYRSFALALMGEYFGQPEADLLINTTVGPNAAAMIGALSDRIPQGDFQTVGYFATAYRGLAAKALRKMRVPMPDLAAYPTAAALRLKDAVRLLAMPSTPRSVVIEAAERFDHRFDAFWDELVGQNPEKLLAVRDRAALSWHFAVPMRRGHLWILTASRKGLLRGYCIFKRQEPDGLVRRMRLIDYQTLDVQDDLLPGLLKAALRRCAQEGFHVLEHLGTGLPKMHSFDRFAPYRRTLPCWPFYYRAADPAIDAQLAVPEVWDPSVFDGDASIA